MALTVVVLVREEELGLYGLDSHRVVIQLVTELHAQLELAV